MAARDLILPQTCSVIEQGMISGDHAGAQLYVSRGGSPVAEVALGDSRPGMPMTTDSIVLWLSSTKPIGAAAVLQLREQGLLELDDPVARHIPEFAAHGKEAVTIRHLLTHTCGFRWVDIGWPENDWNTIIALLCDAHLEKDWTPGQKAGYHPFTSWCILGELVGRVDGRKFSQYVRDEIFEPLGMADSWIGMPVEQYRRYGERIGLLSDTFAQTKAASEPAFHRFSSERGATDCIPGGNGHGPVRELGSFYEMLLAGGEVGGMQVLSRDSVAMMTSRQRVGMFDETFKHVMDWGLGVIIDSKQYETRPIPYCYGPHASPETFGHGGSQSSVGFADPAHGLVVAVVFNGTPGEPRHQRRLQQFCTALYQDLGLAE